jgi:hypothetical protein
MSKGPLGAGRSARDHEGCVSDDRRRVSHDRRRIQVHPGECRALRMIVHLLDPHGLYEVKPRPLVATVRPPSGRREGALVPTLTIAVG